MNNSYFVTCPHCDGLIEVPFNQLNCKIFIHGTYIKNHQQVNPHLSKNECEYLIKNNLVYGCCKPLYFDGNIVYIRDYES
jgi:hypothetical protein